MNKWERKLFSRLRALKSALAQVPNWRFFANISGTSSPHSAMTVGISFFLVAIVMPIGIEAIYAANITGWDASVKTIFQVVLPIIATVGVALKYLRRG